MTLWQASFVLATFNIAACVSLKDRDLLSRFYEGEVVFHQLVWMIDRTYDRVWMSIQPPSRFPCLEPQAVF
jgi:hypothetical protein